MAREAAQIAPGSDGLLMLPYMYGERSPIEDPKARGMLFGLTGDHTRAHIDRAALEGVAYSTNQILNMLAKHAGSPKRITVAGGGTRNPTWMQILADVIGKPIYTAASWQTASYGDACMAAIGCGDLENFHALKQVVPSASSVEPQEENREIYEKYQKLYEELYRVNKDLMHCLP